MVPYKRRATILLALGLAITAISTQVACRTDVSDQALPVSTSLVIPVYETGVYRLTLDAIQDAGVMAHDLGDAIPRLSQGETVIPIMWSGDAIFFYAQGPTDRYSPYRPYLLETEGDGKRMKEVPADPGDGQELSTVPYLLTIEENHFYDGRPYEGILTEPATHDPWFWETIQQGDQIPIQFEVPREPFKTAVLAIDLIGISTDPAVDPDHEIAIVVNGKSVETVTWDGNSSTTAVLNIPEGVLQLGTNTLVLDNTQESAAKLDIMRLDRFTVTYQGAPEAVDGRLETVGANGRVTLSGFANTPLLLDVKEPNAPLQLAIEEGDISIELVPETHLVAVEPDSLMVPQSLLVRGQPHLDRADIQADFIVIAPRSYLSALEPLADHRRSQGLSVELVALEQIYLEFADAGTGPSALSAFLTHAQKNWLAPSPTYLLLVGDATYDYRNYLGQEHGLMIPSPMVSVTYSGETVSDARLADVDGDKRPDMAVGRWPVQDVGQVKDLVQRTIAFETSEVSPRAIFVSDDSESRFAQLNQDVSQQSGLQSNQIAFLDGPSSQELQDEWAGGSWLFTYSGHGSLDRWGKVGLLDNEQVPSLEGNNGAPIVLQLTCLTGLFAHPTITSLSEELLLASDGPVSIIAATSLSLPENQRPFGVAFLKSVQDPEIGRVGDAFQRAKSTLDVTSRDTLREISDTFTLFGDPTTLILRPSGQ